ncbi:MAG: hypothetical protein OSJ63_07415, partial [Bacilli bacterium]|nr:hypothetical protein [Bacilli bacterium]
GTIRLIYDGTTCHNNGEATTDSIALSNEYYTTADGLYFNSSYVGWTYTENLQRPINNDEATPSHAKTIVEEWYNNRLISYEDKIATSKYCNDRDLTIDSIYSGMGTPFNYAGSKRIHNDFKPQLNCNKDDTYKLKVGLITADEVALAGGTNGDNKEYYLYNGQNYWTMTPYFWENTWGFARVFFINDYGKIAYNGVYFNEAGIRPVINLKVDAPVTGNGTINSPYLI